MAKKELKAIQRISQILYYAKIFFVPTTYHKNEI